MKDGLSPKREDFEAMQARCAGLERRLAAVETERGRLRFVLDHITQAYFALDREWRFIEVNQAGAEALDRKPHELLDRNIWEVFPQAVGREFHQAYLKALKEDRPVRFEARSQTTGRWFEVWAYPYPDRLEVYFTDISERKRLEEARRSVALFPEQNPNPVLRVGADGSLQYCNAAGRCILEIWKRQVGEAAPEPVVGMVRQALEAGQEAAFELSCGETYYTFTLAPVPAGDYANLYGTDITERKQKEERLRDSEARERARARELAEALEQLQAERDRWQVMVESMLDLVVTCDAQGRATYMNPPYARLLDMAIEPGLEVERHSDVYRIIHPDGRPFDPTELPLQRAALRGEPVRDVEILQTGADGEPLHLVWNAAPLHDPQGRRQGAVAVGRDLTAQRRAEAALLRSEQRLRLALEAGRTAAWEWEAATDRLYHSDNAAALWGAEVDSGQNAMERIHPEDRPRWQAITQSSGAGGRDYWIEFRVLGDGSGAPRWVESRARAYYGPGGRVERVEGVLVDIHDRKEMEERLAFQALLLETVYDAVIAIDRERRITYWNHAAEALYGWSAEEALGKIFVELIPIEVAPEAAMDAAFESLRESWTHHFAGWQSRRDGRRMFVEGTNTVLLDGQGRAVGYVSVNHDVTSRKLAEEEARRYASELERSNKDLQDFAFIASHDLQEPLRKVHSFGALLNGEAGAGLSGRGRDYLARMVDASERMRRMIEDLLAFSRVSTQGRPFQWMDLGDAVQEALDDLQDRLNRTGGRVEIEPLPEIEADPAQMRQLFQNLIGNSLKFHREGVAPVVRVYQDPGAGDRGPEALDQPAIAICVEDNGIGFEPEYAERIFQPFQRLHGRGEYEGSGIGLAICRRIAERHHGSIQASGAPGAGATFVITLPVRQGG